MKNILTIIAFVSTYALSAQTVDYNTDKGFVAEGYDVVSYFSNIPKEGDDNYVARYDGVLFKFSTQKNLDTFNANPKKYVPQYGGYCAYAIALKNKKVSIDPETFEIRAGKLYLFYNSWGVNTLKSWQEESPNVLILAADKNWNN
jgi:YHS domain-containing protein